VTDGRYLGAGHSRPNKTEGLPSLAEADDDDLAPLRAGEDWRPQEILELLGPCEEPHEGLPRLLVACAVLDGAVRVAELCKRIEQMETRARRRLEQMLRDELLAPRHDRIKGLITELVLSRDRLPTTRAHANNDVMGRPGGLIGYDLRILVHYTSVIILAIDVGTMRNIVGVERALYWAGQPPDLDRAETWLDRLMPGAPLSSVQMFDPEELERRVVIIYHDGVLAYDAYEEYDPDDYEDDETDEVW
jgi:hypothetical protein